MITLHAGMRVYIACGVTDMRRGFDGLAAQVQTVLKLDPHNGAVFVFRGKRGDLVKALMWDGQGSLCMAQGERGNDQTDNRSVVDVAGRDRLPDAGMDGAAGSGGLSARQIDSVATNTIVRGVTELQLR